ncbi:MAG: tetratricopeptide repeat protein [Candidatus Puniceispirillales bacterium WSBS_2018_MAG_OTU23]
MNDIITEINQELRHDRGRALWRKYGVYVIAFVVIVVVLVAGRQGLTAYQENARLTAADAYFSAVERGDNDALNAIIADGGGEGYPMLAGFTAAASQASTDAGDAETRYLALADDENIAPIYRTAALLLSVMNGGTSNVDTRLSRLTPIADSDGPWQQLALEMMIGLAVEKGDIAMARKHFQTLRFSQNIGAELNRRLILIDAAIGE